jgi:two-component system chemotaxis response regulator CheY
MNGGVSNSANSPFLALRPSGLAVQWTENLAATQTLAISVLLVDDNSHMRSIIKELLRAVGIVHIFEAADPIEAFELIKTTQIDLILVDYSMPIVDGVEFTQMVRTSRDSPNPFIPIIMVTGHSERTRVNAARDAGVNEFLVKPVTAKNLIERIDAVANRGRQFVKCGTYFGPDRRRRAAPHFNGPLRRSTDDKLMRQHEI